MSKPARVGLYGGTFDPIHRGHLHLITQLLKRSVVDEIVIIPARIPWMRDEAPSASAQERLEMVRLGIAALVPEVEPRVSVNEIEILRAGLSYTIETVEELKAQSPQTHFVLILGSDAFAGIENWHRSKELLAMIEVLVIAREGEGLDIDALAVSSTRIRAELLNRNSTTARSEDLPESIWKYIKERNLYASK